MVLNSVQVCCTKFGCLYHKLTDSIFRTQAQAKALQEETPVNVVINLDVPFETIVDRIKDRWIHPASGRVYNLVFNPPKVLRNCHPKRIV